MHPPDTGRIEVRGRVGALIALGAGFNPVLTGRENIYLNGSIYGLSRQQINRRIDNIIKFSELEEFIDVPVKHYSSGMGWMEFLYCWPTVENSHPTFHT